MPEIVQGKCESERETKGKKTIEEKLITLDIIHKYHV